MGRQVIHSWFFAVGIAFAGLLVGCHAAAPPAGVAPPPVNAAAPAAAVPVPASRPTTAEGCRACNGVWAAHGIATVESCNCRSRDGGKRCRDGTDCEGACVAAEEPEREVTDAGPPVRGFFVGRCSDLLTVFGCSRFIDRGAVARGPIVLNEPPTQMCVD